MIHYQHVDTLTALKRDRLYATFMFTSMGIPMLWEGIEFGAPRGWDGNRMDYRPVEWNYYKTANGKTQFQYYQKLIRQRRLNPALNAGKLYKQKQYAGERVLVWGYKDTITDTQVEIIANLSSSSQTVYNIPWLSSGTWYDVFDQSTLAVSSNLIPDYTIPAYTAKVFCNRTNTDLGILAAKDERQPLPERIDLAQNYPNPFNPVTTIHFELPRMMRASLVVYDLMGREIVRLVDGVRSAGVYDIRWDATSVPSGMYIYRLTTEAGSISNKLVLLR